MENNFMMAEYSNPYMVETAQPVSMAEAKHEGTALAANAEARVIAETKAQVLMARQYPRDPAGCFNNIMRECARPTFADSAVYSFPRGKETVTGPSIRMAEVLARNWGNNTFGTEVLERGKGKDGVGYSVIRAYAWDLETNTYISRQFELKHWRSTRSGGYAITDDRDIYEFEANMASRRMRACILQMIPGDVTDAAVAACRKTSSNALAVEMKNPERRAALIARTCKAFESLGATAKDLEEYLSARQTDWTADHVLKLKELMNSINDGVTPIGEAFPRLKPLDKSTLCSKEQVQQLMEATAKTGKQGEISDRMKAMGIAKFADVPAARYDEVLAMIKSFEGGTK